MNRAEDRAVDILAELKRTKPVARVDGKLFYIVEGDLLLNESKLQAYALQRAHLQVGGPTAPPPDPLVGIKNDSGRLVRWAKGKVLTYTVVKPSFADEERFRLVVTNMRIAAAEWEATCGVNFLYIAAPTEAPLFTVELLNTGGQFIAAAFFPNDPPEERRLYIDPSYFAPTLKYDRVGVLRHELGHVLGFRHEHIRSGASPNCPHEDTSDTFDFTLYDPRSVMHYFCGGVGSHDLAITDFDRTGARMLYGPPDTEVDYYG